MSPSNSTVPRSVLRLYVHGVFDGFVFDALGPHAEPTGRDGLGAVVTGAVGG